MILFNIAIKNIKRNFYNYFTYFTSMVFSIMIYYIFVSIQYNSKIIEVISLNANVQLGFKFSSIIIAGFVTIFIWYSNSFFTRKRKKEIGLYSLMGIKKRQIGKMLFYENIAMGAIALTSGILIGSLLSKVFIMLLINLMGFSIHISFSIIPKAIFKTIITFGILFLITSIHGYTIIYRFKLIELFNAEKKGEQEPKTSITLSILSLILILSGYSLYLNSFGKNFDIFLLLTLIFVIVGTYLFFSCFVISVIKYYKKNKNLYYKGTNMIGISHLLYRIKDNARTLATIAILSATTLTFMGITSSFYYDFQTKQDIKYPFTYSYYSNDKNIDKKVESIIAKYPKNKLINSTHIEFITLKGTVFNVTDKVHSQDETTFYIISQDMFNKISKIKGIKDRLNLKNPNDTILFDEYYKGTFLSSYKNKLVTTIINNKKTALKIVDFKSHPFVNEYMTGLVLVVNNNMYNEIYNKENIYRINNYITDNKKDSESLTKELKTFMAEYRKESKYDSPLLQFSSYYENYKKNLSTTGILIFISCFLGLVFLIATGSIIFFKQLSEANDYKKRYILLMKIGVRKIDIKNSIKKQILFVFLFPLVVGILHSIVAVSLLGKLLNLNLALPISINIFIYTFIYMIYYFLTVTSYIKFLKLN